jgi:hypothetical protein
MPGSKQAWPNRAACWSPAMPAIGSSASSSPEAVVPNSRLLSWTSGSNTSGTRNSRHSSSSQHWRRMSNSEVRLALVASVAWIAPPVSRHDRKQSMVPQASSPRSARSRAPDTWSRIQAILAAEK